MDESTVDAMIQLFADEENAEMIAQTVGIPRPDRGNQSKDPGVL